jgi:hypothetical protein
MEIIYDIVGCVVLFLAVAIPLSAAVRLATAPFSKRVRVSIKQHPVAHSIWFVIAFLFVLLFSIVRHHARP